MILRLSAALFAISAIGLTILWWQRNVLPYDEQGRYFDAAESVVYQEQAAAVYAVLALASMLLALACFTISRKV